MELLPFNPADWSVERLRYKQEPQRRAKNAVLWDGDLVVQWIGYGLVTHYPAGIEDSIRLAPKTRRVVLSVYALDGGKHVIATTAVASYSLCVQIKPLSVRLTDGGLIEVEVEDKP